MLTAMPDAAMRYGYRAKDGGELPVEAVTGVCRSWLANLKKLAEGG